jgi:ABC-type antimicrobial peptide transport system permease subunit
MLLAALGIYGIVAFTVASRTREIGVRRAVGARPAQIVRLVVAGTNGLVAIGLAIGAAGGVLGGTALGGLIVGVKPFDQVTLTAVAGIVFFAALSACAVPAWRATKVDPLQALRCE